MAHACFANGLCLFYLILQSSDLKCAFSDYFFHLVAKWQLEDFFGFQAWHTHMQYFHLSDSQTLPVEYIYACATFACFDGKAGIKIIV